MSSQTKVKDRPKGPPEEFRFTDYTSILNKNPRYRYYWAADDGVRPLYLKGMGYEPVKKEEAEQEGLQALFLGEGRVDGFVGNRYHILMRIDREEWEKREAGKQQRRDSLLRKDKEGFIADMLKRGLMTVKQARVFEKEGIVERNELGA